MIFMEDLDKLRKVYGLKKVRRVTLAGDRRESSAEHTWSAMIVANYFLDEEKNLDRLKVLKLLMYHDLIEVEVGDTPFHPDHKRAEKEKKEMDALDGFSKKLPERMGEEFKQYFIEYEESKTLEAKFAKAIDALDPLLNELDNKPMWKGWTEKFIRDKKQKYFEPFPTLKAFFDQTLKYASSNGYFSQ